MFTELPSVPWWLLWPPPFVRSTRKLTLPGFDPRTVKWKGELGNIKGRPFFSSLLLLIVYTYLIRQDHISFRSIRRGSDSAFEVLQSLRRNRSIRVSTTQQTMNHLRVSYDQLLSGLFTYLLTGKLIRSRRDYSAYSYFPEVSGLRVVWRTTEVGRWIVGSVGPLHWTGETRSQRGDILRPTITLGRTSQQNSYVSRTSSRTTLHCELFTTGNRNWTKIDKEVTWLV